ncbi:MULTISPECIES: VOC family protein [Bacillaceae]|uniref:VOC family protein n=1 Tax=Evansella alkalicola TaxID=745819 RepID=A0ABS6JSP5_9BACI|nr:MULTISPECIES: VOC family protein [Bacillaceae]MBU9721583.1 VOC family protein [Bacillus alkalicola]
MSDVATGNQLKGQNGDGDGDGQTPSLVLDHVVHYVNDLEEPISVFEKNGLHAFHGGSHKQWGTFNALSYFDLTYIEFMGIEDRDLVVNAKESNLIARDSAVLLPEHELLNRVALRTNDIDAVASKLKLHGLSLSPIIDGKRLNKQDQLIEWRMMTIAGDYQGLVYPFVIQWKGNDEDRLKQLIEAGVVQDHPAGEVSVKNAVFHVEDPVEIASHWAEIFGFGFEETELASCVDEDYEVASLKEAGSRGSGKGFVFRKGNANRLTQLEFQTAKNSKLSGTKIEIGKGEYVFL